MSEPSPLQPAPPPSCPRCSAPVVAGAAFCQSCGIPLAGGAAAVPGGRFVVARGRARTAGWLVGAGGAAIVLSALLPWFTFLGFIGAHLPAGYFVAFGAAGALIAYFGFRALQDRVTKAIMVTLWTLSALAAFVAVGLVSAAHDVQNQSFGTVTPASGFYVGLVGLFATGVGTIVLQTTRSGAAPAPPRP
jgi:hypothetical protein